MAEQIISPGVFTRENDLSFLPQGIGQIGAAIIGPTEQGPAFVPTVVRSFAEFQRRFGTNDTDTYVPQTVREYLRNAGSVTVCRVLGGGGYTYSGDGADGTNEVVALVVSSSNNANDRVLLGAIFPSKSTSTPDLSKTVYSPNATPVGADHKDTHLDFNIILSGSAGGTGATNGTSLSASINPANENYLFKQLGNSPNNSKTSATAYNGTPGYTYVNFNKFTTNVVAGTNIGTYNFPVSASLVTSIVGISTQSADMVFSGGIGKTEGYGYASTPFITSQFIGGAHPNKTVKELFKFHTLDHGKHLCHKYKISIANLKEPNDIDGVEQYSRFSVLVRKTDDKDKSPVILEQFNDITLDPDSPRYISRVIGDRYPDYNELLGKVELKGNYPNQSNYIRVEVSDAVGEKAISPKLSPYGFKAVSNPINGASFDPAFTIPSASYEGIQTLTDSSTTPITYSSKGYLGFKFLDKASDNENFLQPLHDSAQANVAGDFNVMNHYGHPSGGLWTGTLSASLDQTGQEGPTNSQLKFTIPFQGGDDGIAPYQIKNIGDQISSTNLYGFDLSGTNKAGYTAYNKALTILSNQDEYDINMLALPGVIKEHHKAVTDAAIDMAESRGDCFYVMDLADVESTVRGAISTADGLDSSYAAVYYPWVKVTNSRNQPVLVPPSVIVPGAIAASDRIAAEWFAPAGLNRGVLGNVLEAKIRLNQAERDLLYDAKINPIATFPQTGVCIWGQKTLQERSTALDRINVRRLLIALKKFIASSSRYLVFEQNTQATRNRFLNIVNPYLESVQSRQGLFAFRVQMDEGNNTPDVIDRNQLVGAIYLQPAKTAEFIILDFNVLPTGATFDGGGGTGGGAGGGGATGGGGGGY